MINDLGPKVFGDLWAYPFNVEVWGNVGQWVSSIFAGASLLVALSIVRHDRSKDDWTSARKVQTWTDFYSASLSSQGERRTWSLTLEVLNNSDRPIYDVTLRFTPKKGSQLEGEEPFETAPVDEVHPGERRKSRIEIMGPEPEYNNLSVADMLDDVVYFTSENGIIWEKSSRGARLRIHKKKWRLRRIIGL